MNVLQVEISEFDFFTQKIPVVLIQLHLFIFHRRMKNCFCINAFVEEFSGRILTQLRQDFSEEKKFYKFKSRLQF